MSWKDGHFEFSNSGQEITEDNFTESVASLLLEASQEVDMLSDICSEAPALESKLSLKRPMPGVLKELSPDQLEVVQLTHDWGNMLDLLDHASGSDLVVTEILIKLIEKGWITTD